MIVELLPNMIKAIKILQGHKVSTKTTKSANTSAKPKYYAQSENDTKKLLPEKNEVFKKLWEYRLITKAQRMQMKAQKQQSTAHNSKNDTWTIAEYDKSHQNIAGTQDNYEKTKNAEENAKATKYCTQQQKWYMNYCRIW